MAGKCCRFLEGKQASELLSSLDTFIFDCDGVLWNAAGALDGAVEVLQCIRKLGKRVFFVTNNSSKSRKEYLKKCDKLGIEACEEEIYGTAFAAAYYLKEVLKFDKKVYIIATTGIVEELDAVGIRHIGSGPDHTTGGYNIQEWTSFTLDPEVGAVICGFDEHFSLHKLIKANSYLARESCIFVATNRDDRFPFRDTDVVLPGTGCLVSAVETAARRKAIVVGKPEKLLFDCMNSNHGIDPSKTCMVGDRLDTDILFGNKCGLKTILVLTGVSSLNDVACIQNSDSSDQKMSVPDFYVPSIKDLLLPFKSLN